MMYNARVEYENETPVKLSKKIVELISLHVLSLPLYSHLSTVHPFTAMPMNTMASNIWSGSVLKSISLSESLVNLIKEPQ